MREDQFENLKELISRIHELHNLLAEEWADYALNSGFLRFNQKSVKVKHLDADQELTESVYGYVDFLRGRTELTEMTGLFDGYEITSRVKNYNSIEEKIEDYCRKRVQKGEVSVNKCLNDLFGTRIIIDCESISDDDLLAIIGCYPGALLLEDKDVPARESIPPYKAKHIYFKRGNEDFRWELQIWRSADQLNNHESHRKHRYIYRGWEADGSKGA